MTKSRKSSGILSNLIKSIDKVELEKTSNKMLIAAKIGDALKREGLSQKEFAAKIGKSESEISAWLSGDRNFTIDTLIKISYLLNISLIDTSIRTTYIIPVGNIMATTEDVQNTEVAEEVTWTYSVSYDCNTKELKVV